MQFLMSHLHALGSPKNHSSAVFGRARSRFGAESKVFVLCQNTERSSEFDMTRTDACGPLGSALVHCALQFTRRRFPNALVYDFNCK